MTETQARDLQKQIGAIYDRLTAMETTLKERCSTKTNFMEKLEVRLRYLEVRNAMALGGLLLLSVLTSYTINLWGVNL